MKIYNNFMLYFWLAMGIVTTVTVTYYGITEGFDRWYHFYLFAVIAFLMFFLRRTMLKRMEKHQKFLDDQANNQNID